MALLFQLLFVTLLAAHPEVYLRDHLRHAETGDYLVTLSNKLYTVLLVKEREGSRLILDEISIPEGAAKQCVRGWEAWLLQGSPQASSWLRHTIETSSGKLLSLYSFTQNGYLDTAGVSNLFSTLLNLPFTSIPLKEQRMISLPDGRAVPWQPKLFNNGREIQGVTFFAFRSTFPKDGSDLSGMEILIYLPEDSSCYPSYFPYWLKIKGNVLKALVRAVDSGKLSTIPPFSN